MFPHLKISNKKRKNLNKKAWENQKTILKGKIDAKDIIGKEKNILKRSIHRRNQQRTAPSKIN
jgi:hypothetical protein